MPVTQKIGPREEQLRALRARNLERAQARSRQDVGTLREKVAAIPARKPPKQKKARR